MSSATGKALEPTVLKVDPEDLMSVLYIEHDVEYRESTVERLRQIRCKVDYVSYPKEAISKLLERTYQMIVFDVKFPNSHVNGDRFVFSNRSIVGTSRLVALTGQPSYLEPNIVEDMNIQVIKKGSEDKLTLFSQDVYEEVQKEAIENFETAKEKVLHGEIEKEPPPWAVKYLEKARDDLLNGLQGLPDKESKTILYGGETYSVQDFIDHVQNGTALGGEIIEMMLDLVRWRNRAEIKNEETLVSNSNIMAGFSRS